MCLLTYIPDGVMPDVDALANGAIFNDDGHGYAIVSGDRLIVDRSLDSEYLIGSFAEVRSKHLDGPALFHSRFGTHGSNSVRNCHPFHVGGDKRTIIAHNGVLPKDVHPGKKDWRSDTRIAAEDFIPQLGHLRARRTRLRLQRWMTTANKMVVLTVDRSFREQSYILNEQAGTWDGGIWYSNSGYLPSEYGRWSLEDWKLEECRHCGLPNKWCQCYEVCPDCLYPSYACLCWRGRHDLGPPAATQGTGWPEAEAVPAKKLA